jgi:hypothetical protein
MYARDLDLIPDRDISNYSYEATVYEAFKHFNDYKGLADDIYNRGMYAPIFLNSNGLVKEGVHRVFSLQNYYPDLRILTIDNPSRFERIQCKAYMCQGAMEQVQYTSKVSMNNLEYLYNTTLQIDMINLNKLRVENSMKYSPTKFFTDEDVFNRLYIPCNIGKIDFLGGQM